jgi:predicted N-acyltransferase
MSNNYSTKRTLNFKLLKDINDTIYQYVVNTFKKYAKQDFLNNTFILNLPKPIDIKLINNIEVKEAVGMKLYLEKQRALTADGLGVGDVFKFLRLEIINIEGKVIPITDNNSISEVNNFSIVADVLSDIFVG